MQNLLKNTLALLDVTTEPFSKIQKAINKKHGDKFLSLRWIYKMKDREMDDPSQKRTQALGDYLAGR